MGSSWKGGKDKSGNGNRSTSKTTVINSIDPPGPEPGEYINALPFERHIIYFLQTDTDIILILSQHQDAGRHLNWQ